VSNDRPNSAPAVDRAAVHANADGVTIGDRFVPRAEIQEGFVLPGSSPRVLLRRAEAPIEIHMGSAEEARTLLRALRLDVSQKVATFQALSRALAKRRYGVAAFGGFLALQVIAIMISRAIGVGEGVANIVASVLAALATVTIFGTPTRLSVGADGIALRWLWTRRFFGYDEINHITRFDKVWWGAHWGPDGWQYAGQVLGLRIVLHSGEEVLVPITLGSLERNTDVPIVPLIEERIRGAMDTSCCQDGPPDDAPLLRRGNRDMGVWVAALRSIGAGANADLRTAPITRERLFRIVEDPASPAADRAAAAVALAGAVDEENRMRLRSAAEATAEPKLRVAIEKAADGENDAEIEAALAEAEGEDIRRGVR
jgi:hypothetical protein